MVEDVEELRPKAKSHFLRQVKLPLDGNIRLSGSEAAHSIAPEITLLPGWRRGESRFVEDLAARIWRPKELKWRSWDYIRTRFGGNTASEDDSSNQVNRGR